MKGGFRFPVFGFCDFRVPSTSKSLVGVLFVTIIYKMSFENEEKLSPDQFAEANDEAQKKLRISYTRDFLLSLSDLDVCKNLPSGFDQLLLSEFEDASQDRQRTSGGLSLNSFRRNEYGSSPPTRGDSSSYSSRGIHGRWESRSSGRSDKESDSQSDWDSDSGRRYGNQPRRSWQVPEHDGLLGSGSFPRPSGYAAGAPASKARPNENYQLSRSNEPYHPPRPYKAVPHSRREANDSYNDETFGPSEFTSEDRAEEERKRRASFESMRKEQHKSFQEKQKSNLDKNKDEFDISTLMEESKDDERSLKRSSESDELVRPLASDDNSERSSAPLQTTASRPLVPPGFTSTILDRAKSLNQSHEAEVGNIASEENLSLGKSNSIVNSTSDEVKKQIAKEIGLSKPQHESANSPSINSQSRKGPSLPSVLDASDKSDGISSILHDKTNIAQVFEVSKSSEVIELNAEKVNGSSVLGESNQDHPTSILDKLFGGALTLNVAGSSSDLEHHNGEAEDVQSPQTSQSSKFAHWFKEEEKKPSKDQSSGRPNVLLSLLVGGEKDGSRVSGNRNEKSLPNLPLQNSETADKLVTSDVVSASLGSFDKLFKDNKPEPVSAVLRCEDLEQTILSEISDNGSVPQLPARSWTGPDGKTEQRKANNDHLASQHLLSLLQKGTSAKDVDSSSNLDTLSSDNVHDIKEASIATALHNSIEAKAENISDPAKTLTLETLFGSAFMKELQSVGAPVSSQRGPVGSAKVDASEPHGFPFLVADDLRPLNETGFNTTAHESGVLMANKRRQTKFDNIEEQWFSFSEPQAEINKSQLRTNFGSKIGGFDAPADVRLPEEDSLITASDPLNLDNFMPPGSIVKSDLLSSSSPPVDFVEKLASFNSAFRDERSIHGGQEPPFLRGPYDMRESGNPYQNLNIQPSFPQLHPPQLSNNMRPMFHHLDSRPVNVNSQMKFMAPEAVTHHDPAPNHQIPLNMHRHPFHHPGSGLSGFDQPIPHPMLQQMHLQGNFPSNPLQGLPRGPSLPPHPNRIAPMPAHPPFASLGMPQPAPDIVGGSGHPEAFQRLIDMELRSNSKQIHPFAGGGQSPGMYGHGHELDMGLGFR